MPKRVFGVCPTCGATIRKSDGALRAHFVETAYGRAFCSGSGKRVATFYRPGEEPRRRRSAR